MQPEAAQKLEMLRADFAHVVGRPFSHFFCPVLFRDEKTPLCQAHIVNAAFPESPRRWTLQRQDVDNFYGSVFESDFAHLQHRGKGVAAKALVDPRLHRALRPKILLDGREVEYFVANGPVPNQFAQVVFEGEGRKVRLGLKLPTSEVLAKTGANWQITVLRDVRLATIVSVLKAAHLTLYEMLGYRYALGPGGQYLGQLLGQFFVQNIGRGKAEVLASAAPYFSGFVTMVRPVKTRSSALSGSIEDGSVRVCWTEGDPTPRPWGGIVFVRTHRMVHAALVPVFEDAEGAKRFERFLESDEDMLNTSVARFEKDHWLVSNQRVSVKWPAARLA